MRDSASHDRHAARLTGLFFIIATALLFVGQALYAPLLEATDVFAAIQASKVSFVTGVLVEFLCVLAIPMIAVAIYPILRRFSGIVALAYLVLRTLEAGLIIGISHVNKLALVTLAETSDATVTSSAVSTLTAQSAWARPEGPVYVLVFVIGTLVLNTALWRAKLVPRWISAFGVIAAIGIGLVSVASIFVEIPDLWAISLVAPIAVQEMVLAIWLIVRGVDARGLAADYSAATLAPPSISPR